MATIKIPGGDEVTTRDPGMAEKKPREMSSGFEKAEKMKASPVFDVLEGSGEGRGAGMNGGAMGSGGSGNSVTGDPSNSTGTGIW